MSSKSHFSRKLASQNLGHWLLRDKSIILKWVEHKVEQAKVRKDPMNSNLQAFSDYIANDVTLNNLANLMFSEVPVNYNDGNDPTGHPSIPDFATFIQSVNTILVTGPEFYELDDPNAMGLIGFPINAILDWPMGTKSGWAFWFDPEVKLHFVPVLADFTAFLGSEASKAVLKAPSGWVGEQAQQLLSTKGNDGQTSYTFTEFVRGFRTGVVIAVKAAA
jgi:phosphatidylserine decarboxylase